jgi:membrane associated rhomboid family serine protease
MFFFLPYRVKNPPKRFPWATIGLIVINVLVFLLTSEYGLFIRESIAERYGLSSSNIGLLTLFTHQFLHAHILHLAGNMLFLWIFGAAVEGRLGPLFYLLLYLVVGVAGGLSHQLLSGVVDPFIPLVGASGAIFGLAGAYLYLAPFAHIMVAYCVGVFLKFWAGAVSVAAQWVILGYGVMNLIEGMMFRDLGGGGVANFAHLGGMAAGFLILLASGMKRESEEYADAQAARSDSAGNLLSMPLYELEALIDGPEPTPDIMLAFCRKATMQAEGSGHRVLADVLRRHERLALETDPEQLAPLILALPDHCRMSGSFLLRLAGKLESAGSYELAARTYRAVGRDNETAPETETALLRLGRLTEQMEPDKAKAAAVYTELLRLFPNGEQAAYARVALARLPKSAANFSFSHGTTAPAPGGLGTVAGATPPPSRLSTNIPTDTAEEEGDAPQMPTITLAPIGGNPPQE